MKIEIIKDSKIWNQFVGSQAQNQFLQAWEWGEFQKLLGRGVERWAAKDEKGEILAWAQVLIYPVNFKIVQKNYWYLARGPLGEVEAGKKLVNFLIERAQKAGAMFFKCEPLTEKVLDDQEVWQKTKAVQPQDTWILKLDTPEKMLAQMHPKTRYNIRLAAKKCSTITVSEDQTALKNFYQLLKHTSKRENFGIYNFSYFEKLRAGLAFDENKITAERANFKIYLAHYQKQVVGGILVMFFGDTATYLFGGFDEKYRNLMLPHLLQWRAITDAQARGFSYYDFWGIAPADLNNHAWAGFSRFKKGFGGFEVNYSGTYDLILNKFWTGLYRLAKKII